MDFILHSDYQPTGDQPEAIEALTEGFRQGSQAQTLLGVTGSGKTFTMANVIRNLQKPTLVIAHNKTLAAQLYGEFKEFFPENAVEYFVSYYDYYQPEAYVPQTDTYIEKDSSINDEIDKLRLSATASLVGRKDVIVVSSVSCIYGLGSPIDFKEMALYLRVGEERDRNAVLQDQTCDPFDEHRGLARTGRSRNEKIVSAVFDRLSLFFGPFARHSVSRFRFSIRIVAYFPHEMWYNTVATEERKGGSYDKSSDDPRRLRP